MGFTLSKIVWALAEPGTLLVLVLGLGALGALAPWRRVRALGRGLLGLGVLALVAVAVLPLGAWLLVPLEERFPAPRRLPERVDGVVVLGGAIRLSVSADRGSAELNEYADRMTTFAALARRFPEARLVFAGGSGSLGRREHREADFAVGLFADLGLDLGRIQFERDSRNTRENALFSRDLVRPQPGETWLLVTSAFHMPRAVGVFRRLGWVVTPYPVDYQTGGAQSIGLGFEVTRSLTLLSRGLHEWLGLVGYRILGWTDRLFPAPR